MSELDEPLVSRSRGDLAVNGPTAESAWGPNAGDRRDRSGAPDLDLDLIERDLADVEAALVRLDAGTYFVDEVTGAELPDEFLETRPTARRAP
jgi:RNA polymerase-binding transcription factor DksA